MNWKLFLGGLESAASGGALLGLTQTATSGQAFGKATLITAGMGALLGVLKYLQQPAGLDGGK